jgi:hypothetical protein
MPPVFEWTGVSIAYILQLVVWRQSYVVNDASAEGRICTESDAEKGSRGTTPNLQTDAGLNSAKKSQEDDRSVSSSHLSQ